MSKAYVYLSFFKTNKIDYIYKSELHIIEFACIHCKNSTASMSSKTSAWFCTGCNQSGNIINLIEYGKHNSFRKIFVPKKEQKSILQMLDRLSRKYPHEKGLSTVKNKVMELINYYEKTPYSQ